jgi:hypothetical protein
MTTRGENDYETTHRHHLRRLSRAFFEKTLPLASSSFAECEEASSKTKKTGRNATPSAKKNLPDLPHAVAKSALRELFHRQSVLNYQPSSSERSTVNDFVNASIWRVLFAVGLTGAFGFATVDVNSFGFKNKTNAFRARVLLGAATGALGGMFEYRSVNFYRNLAVKILDEEDSKMSAELAEILRERDPLGEFVKDQERKKNRERLRGFRDGRKRMMDVGVTVEAERREGGEDANAPSSSSFERAVFQKSEGEEEEHRGSAPPFFFFSDVFGTTTTPRRDGNGTTSPGVVVATTTNKLRAKEAERRKRIREAGLERRRQTGGGALFD